MSRSIVTLAVSGLALASAVHAQKPQSPAPPVLVPMRPPAPPPAPIPELFRNSPNPIIAAKAWAKGGAVDAAKIYAAAKVDLATMKAPFDARERQFLADWIVALSYSDPAAAQTKLDAWLQADPEPEAFSGLGTFRLMLGARILIRQANIDGAMQMVASRRRAFDSARAAEVLRDEAMRKARKKGGSSDFSKIAAFNAAEPGLRAAEFLVETARSGEAAFAKFSGSANPFRSNAMALFINGRNDVSCASAGLKPEDWMIAEIAYDRASKATLVMPFAQSRDDMLEPYLAAIPEWNQSYLGRLDATDRQHLFVRCGRGVPPATDARPDYAYLFEYLQPRVPVSEAAYKWDLFRDPVSNLVRDNQWGYLLGAADRGNPLAPYVRVQAERALLSSLRGETKPDPVAIAIAENWALELPEVGREGSAKRVLPLHVAALDKARAVTAMPPRILARMEFELGELYEKAGDPVTAQAVYAGIVSRAGAALLEKSAEVVKASLRLAGIADAAGKKAEADAIIARLGLSPEQCSVYQAKPAITKLPTPQYPSRELREEKQGSVQFEFDLSQTGTPTNFRVITSAPPFVFDAATVSSFAKASFAPATRGGEALACEAATQGFVWRMPEY